MSQQNKNPNQQPQLPKQLDSEVIKAIIDQQAQKIQLELQRVELEKLRQGDNTKLAHTAMANQAAYLSSLPAEQRKTFTRIGYVVGGFVALILAFLGFLVYTGNKDFADTFLKFCSYIVTSGLSFYVGRKSVSTEKPVDNANNSIQDADVISD